jgi:hypothetical protein
VYRRAVISTQYDAIFAKHAGPIPVTYLRALAYRESGLQPLQAVDIHRPGAARGLFQVVGVVRDDFNRRHGTDYAPDDLWDADINTMIAVDTLDEMIRCLGRHPSKNLRPNWENPEFVRLVTAAWNAGHSDTAGVGRVAAYLDLQGIPITHAAVYTHAHDAGATDRLSDPARSKWQRSVADLYFDQRDRGSSLSLWLLALAVAALGFALLSS